MVAGARTGLDITDERRAEEAVRGIESIGTLLATTGPTPYTLAAVLNVLADRMGYRFLALFLWDEARLSLGAQLGYGPLVDGTRAAIEWWAAVIENGAEITLAGVSILHFDADGLVVEQWDTWNHGEGLQIPPQGWGERTASSGA